MPQDRISYEDRLARCGKVMGEHDLDALLLTKPSNLFYLTGDGRLCSYALVSADGRVVLGVPRTDVEDVSGLAHADDIVGFDDEVGMIHAIAAHFKWLGLERGKVGLEYTFVTQSMKHMLTHPHAKPAEVEVKDATAVLSQLRLVKEPGEVDRIRRAAEVGALGMKAATEAVRPGVTESQVAGAGEHAMREAGAEEFWRSYVSSGPRSSIAHGVPSQRVLQAGDLVMIDLHPIVEGYSADLCRTVSAGPPGKDQHQDYQLYLEAQEETVARCRSGVTVGDLEKSMHEKLRAGGAADAIFGPPIHGVGIDFEEAPLPPGHAFFHGEKEAAPLVRNVVLAIGNCGLYRGPWGVRVEDTVVVGQEESEILTRFPRSLASS